MRKSDKLYTVNRWNKPLFMGEGHVFDGFNYPSQQMQIAPSFTLDYNMINQRLGALGANVTNNLNSGTAAAQPTIGNTMGTIGTGLSAAVGNLAGNMIADGYSAGSGVGAVTSAVQAVNTGNPIIDSIKNVGVGILGGVFNRGFGIKENKENVAAVKQGMADKRAAGNAMSAVTDSNSLLAASGMMSSGSGFKANDLYKDGWWTSKGTRKGEALLRDERNALAYQNHALGTGAATVDNILDSNVLGSFSAAYGGELNRNDSRDRSYSRNSIDRKDRWNSMNRFDEGGGMGVLEYNLMSDLMANKKRQTELKEKMAGNMFMGMPKEALFAIGGDLQTNGADFSSGLRHIDAGQRHEENPNGGVQVGIAPDGEANLVEEGEVIYDNYVFSDRIQLDEETKKAFHFPKKKEMTFADAAKRLEKEIQERTNDAISRAGFRAQMEKLEEEQERQKAEMEAKRAEEAFEALSDEEKVAVMQQAAQQEQAMAQQEAMAQEAAMQEQGMQEPTADAASTVASPEEQAMMEQQAQVPVMAEGGHLFPWGGYENLFNVDPPYAASKTAGYIPYSRKLTPEEVMELEKEQRFIDWTNYVNEHWNDEYVQNYLKALDKAAGGNHLFDAEGKLVEGAKDYFNKARTQNHLWGYYHLTPEQIAEAKASVLDELGVSEADLAAEKEAARKQAEAIINGTDGGAVVDVDDNSQGKPVSTDSGSGVGDVEPRYREDRLRYAGLLGPAVGLGLMAAGVGRPNNKLLDEALGVANSATRYADYKPIGNYLTYRPMDIWYEQNRMNANARATDRALANTASPSRAAGLLANGYNTLLASGDLYRKALEYNDALRRQTAEFNRGTDQYNSQAYNQNQQFNAQMDNAYRRYRGQLAMQAAQQKMANDAGWYNSLYGNVGNLFKGIGELGRENAQHNMIADIVTSGIVPGVNPDSPIFRKYSRRKKDTV